MGWMSRDEIENLCRLVPLTAEGGRKGEQEVEEDGGGQAPDPDSETQL